jgi:hypothetical protein
VEAQADRSIPVTSDADIRVGLVFLHHVCRLRARDSL